MIAVAIRYDVRTHVIWSGEADTLPWMCGRATLAIVLSSEFITAANIRAMAGIGTRLAMSEPEGMAIRREALSSGAAAI